jgi:hypothetical protein
MRVTNARPPITQGGGFSHCVLVNFSRRGSFRSSSIEMLMTARLRRGQPLYGSARKVGEAGFFLFATNDQL